MASDFHTHNPDTDIPALLSSADASANRFVSLEIHPWHLPDVFDPAILPSSEILKNFSALGEIGLDKLRGTNFLLQNQYLCALLKLAADCKKPVVIHCVRAFQELFAALKPFTDLKVMFHGFRSSPEVMDELWKRNITVSFHHSAAQNPELMKKLVSPAGAYGWESDDNNSCCIPQILDEIKTKYKIRNIETFTDQCFADFLEI